MEAQLEKCRNGYHDFIIVKTIHNHDESNTVIRWCEACGALVADAEICGRTLPGEVKKITIPSIEKKLFTMKARDKRID